MDNSTPDPIVVAYVDDNADLVDALSYKLRREPGFAPLVAITDFLDPVPAIVAARPHVLLLDYDLPSSRSTTDIIRDVHAALPATQIVVFTGHPDQQLAADVMQHGARGFLVKGIPTERLYNGIRRAAAGERVIEFDT